MASFMSNWGGPNYEKAIANRFFCQVQFGQVGSQTLKSIIVVEWRREVNSSRGTSGKACGRTHSELQIVIEVCGLTPWILVQFLNSVPNVQQQYVYFFLAKLYFPLTLAVGRSNTKEKKTTGNSFSFRWTSRLRGIITNPQGPSWFILLLSPLLSPFCLYPLFLCLPSCVRATSSVLPSGTVTNWHAEFSTGTLNPRDQACRQSSFISSPFANCVCSSHSALGRFWHKGPISRISHLLPGCKRKNNNCGYRIKVYSEKA